MHGIYKQTLKTYICTVLDANNYFGAIEMGDASQKGR